MSKKYYFSIVAMFKNESWGLKEWIEHNKLHGVDHIYLVDDFSEDDSISVLQPYIDSDYVTLFKNEFSERFKGRDRKSTRLNSSHVSESRMPSSA